MVRTQSRKGRNTLLLSAVASAMLAAASFPSSSVASDNLSPRISGKEFCFPDKSKTLFEGNGQYTHWTPEGRPKHRTWVADDGGYTIKKPDGTELRYGLNVMADGSIVVKSSDGTYHGTVCG